MKQLSKNEVMIKKNQDARMANSPVTNIKQQLKKFLKYFNYLTKKLFFVL